MGSEPLPVQPFAEDRAPDGSPRPLYAPTLAALAATDLDRLAADVARHLDEAGVAFGDRSFVVDPVPRLIAGAEWDLLERGLAQRTRALNEFLRDAYGKRRIVTAGLVSAEVIDEAEGYEPDLAGRLPATAAPAAIIGFDLVRDPEGRFVVLEDNLRTPSGLAYLLAARGALRASLPDGFPVPRPVDPAIPELLRATLAAAAPPGRQRDPRIVVATDGADNTAYYEHAMLAERLGVPLVTPEDFTADDDGLTVRLAAGDVRRVDVVYRRTDEDRVRDEQGRMTPIAELLLPPWLDGKVGLVNAFGNGIADDKLVHGHVEDFIRFYLDEAPLVRSVPTLPLDSAEAVDDAIGALRRLVIKPRHGHGGSGVTIGSQADDRELARVAAELQLHPELYIAQPIVPLSQHPTVIDGHLEPRHVDLRPFAFCADGVHLTPGGLSRVAFEAGEMVVNSSRNGGGKDTWVID